MMRVYLVYNQFNVKTRVKCKSTIKYLQLIQKLSAVITNENEKRIIDK